MVTTRGHVHGVVTEYGAVNVHGLILRGRTEALITIARPIFPADLKEEAAALRHFSTGGSNGI